MNKIKALLEIITGRDLANAELCAHTLHCDAFGARIQTSAEDNSVVFHFGQGNQLIKCISEYLANGPLVDLCDFDQHIGLRFTEAQLEVVSDDLFAKAANDLAILFANQGGVNYTAPKGKLNWAPENDYILDTAFRSEIETLCAALTFSAEEAAGTNSPMATVTQENNSVVVKLFDPTSHRETLMKHYLINNVNAGLLPLDPEDETCHGVIIPLPEETDGTAMDDLRFTRTLRQAFDQTVIAAVAASLNDWDEHVFHFVAALPLSYQMVDLDLSTPNGALRTKSQLAENAVLALLDHYAPDTLNALLAQDGYDVPVPLASLANELSKVSTDNLFREIKTHFLGKNVTYATCVPVTGVREIELGFTRPDLLTNDEAAAMTNLLSVQDRELNIYLATTDFRSLKPLCNALDIDYNPLAQLKAGYFIIK